MAADPGAAPAPDIEETAEPSSCAAPPPSTTSTPSMRTLLAAGAAAEAVCTPPQAPARSDRSDQGEAGRRRTPGRRDAA